jgi:hypothetical protein
MNPPVEQRSVATTPGAGATRAGNAGLARIPVVVWACLGAAVVAFNMAVWTRWITGPLFHQVPYGPSSPTTWMKAVLISWQAAGIAVAFGLLYILLIRPWRRERVVRTDGLLVIAFFFMCFQEPLWSYFGHWFTYNAYLVNFGSWLGSVPGVRSFHQPGAMLVYPILWIGPVYPLVFLVSSWLGVAALRYGRRRYPSWSNTRLVLCVLFPAMFIYDVVLEGVVFMPLGFYTYAGGVGPALFPHAYHKFPLTIAVSGVLLFSGIASFRYFTDDRGQTLVERGTNRLRIGPRLRGLVRFFALAGAVQLIFFVTAGAPHMLVGAHSSAWNTDLQSRSYFLDRLCGTDTPRACPGRQGKPSVPFNNGHDAPFTGPIFGWVP